MRPIGGIGRVLASAVLLMGAAEGALATDYSGTLSFSNYVTSSYGFDINAFDLGSALSGSSVDISFTTHNSFYPNGTMLAVAFATDPNEAILSNPTSLLSQINASNFGDMLNANVKGLQYYVYGSSTPWFDSNGGTTSISGVFNPPMSFTMGTHYYAFVTGGTLNLGGNLANSSVGYTMSVSAPVPEPEDWAMMMAGIGVIGLLRRRHRAARSAQGSRFLLPPGPEGPGRPARVTVRPA